MFLAVVSSLFALFISAYFMRMQVADWVQLPAPKLLWFNTGVLILSSVALQYAHVAARRGRIEGVRDGLIAGGLFALTFLVGQLFAWRQLNAAGYYLAANPGNAFFICSPACTDCTCWAASWPWHGRPTRCGEALR